MVVLQCLTLPSLLIILPKLIIYLFKTTYGFSSTKFFLFSYSTESYVFFFFWDFIEVTRFEKLVTLLP